MADLTGSPLPAGQNVQPGKNRSGSAAQGQRRNNRNRKQQSQSIDQFDGTASDSATPGLSSTPHSKRAPRQRQSVAAGDASSAQYGQGPQQPRAHVQSPIAHHATPQKQMPAYAGPTFHASPAPSSLPVPRFFSRSVPNVTAPVVSFQERMEGERPLEGKVASPGKDTVIPVPARASQQSPLDVFFNADKVEREKRRTSSALQSPENGAVPLQVPAIEPFNRQHANPFQQPAKHTLMRETDGDIDGDVPSPRTVPQNMPSMSRAQSSPGNVPQVDASADQRDAYTKSLKDLLMRNVQSQPPQSNQHHQQRPQSTPMATDPAFMQHSPFNRNGPGPSTPPTNAEEQSAYSLHHYGNRNLSPMFKAVRNETPARPSSLRQELNGGAYQPPDMNGYNHARANGNPQQTSTAAHSYIVQQVRASQPNQYPFQGASNGQYSAPSHPNAYPGSPQRAAAPPQSSASPRAGGSQDISAMENDLRRMLKLDVLG